MKIRLVLVLLALFGGAFVLFKVVPADGATLTTPRIYLNRQKINLGAADAVQYEVFFTTVGSITNGKVKLNFPTDNTDDDTKWCRTAGSDLTVTQIQNPTGATETASASTMGTLAASCTQTDDQIVVTFDGTINATTKYGLRISNGTTAKLGTGSGTPPRNSVKVTIQTTTSGDVVTDSGISAIALIGDDQVVVTALVDATLSVTLDQNAAALGTLSTGTVSKAPIVSTVSTSAANGYISLVKYDQTLTSGVNTIGGVSGGTIAAGESEYGASTSDSGNAIGQWSPASCSSGASTSNATTLTTSFQSFASSGVAATNEATTLCFLTSASATQAPGTYTSTATLVTTALF